MKIIKLKNSILILIINTKFDFVKCYLFFNIGFFKIKSLNQKFQLEELNMAQVKDFYNNLTDDWNRKYRI